jgi:hypothetical protein
MPPVSETTLANPAAEGVTMGGKMAEKFYWKWRLPRHFWVLLHAVKHDMGQTALLPLRRKACWGFFCPKNPMASAGFDPANLGTTGQHGPLDHQSRSYRFRFASTKHLASKLTKLSFQIIISSFIRKLKSRDTFAYCVFKFSVFFLQKLRLEFCSISLPYPHKLVSGTIYFPWLITFIIFGKV